MGRAHGAAQRLAGGLQHRLQRREAGGHQVAVAQAHLGHQAGQAQHDHEGQRRAHAWLAPARRAFGLAQEAGRRRWLRGLGFALAFATGPALGRARLARLGLDVWQGQPGLGLGVAGGIRAGRIGGVGRKARDGLVHGRHRFGLMHCPAYRLALGFTRRFRLRAARWCSGAVAARAQAEIGQGGRRRGRAGRSPGRAPRGAELHRRAWRVGRAGAGRAGVQVEQRFGGVEHLRTAPAAHPALRHAQLVGHHPEHGAARGAAGGHA